MKVPYLPKQHIAEIAEDVVSDYKALTGTPALPPLPVEDIIERSLGLTLGFIDFEEKYSMPDVYGATYVKKKFIAISTTILDERSEGRYCFTCAHEIGHWVLHRRLVDAAARMAMEEEAVFCREKDAKAPIEWQADYFAGCLLMPEHEVAQAFHQAFGSDDLNLYNVQRIFPTTPFHFDICVDNWQHIADAVRRAGGFSNVSRQAMMIRLQDLGLVINHTGHSINWRRLKYRN